MRKNIFFALIFLGSTLATTKALSRVEDGPLYSKDQIPLSLENQGGKAGSSLPLVSSTFDDRETYAPTNTPVFVLDSDDKCYWGEFTHTDVQKKLFVYSQSPVSIDHCIYQKKFNRDPEGFSILSKDGGICRPSYSDSLETLKENLKGAIHIIDRQISLSHCVEHTVSYGAILEKRTDSARATVEKAALERAPTSSTDDLEVKLVKVKDLSPKVENGIFTVQLSSHPTLEEAQANIKTQQDNGIKAFYTVAVVQGKKWYRVSAGHFQTLNDARSYKKMISKTKGLISAFVTKLIP